MRTMTNEEIALAQEVNACTLSHYKYFTAGVLMGLPLSINRKTYWPFVLAAVAGSAADFMEAQETCKPQREALDRCIARQRRLEEEQRRQAEGHALGQDGGRPQDSWEGDEFREDSGGEERTGSSFR